MSCPAFLQPGDTICLVSPSGRVNPDYLTGAVAYLEQAGYRVEVGAHAQAAYGRFAGTDEERISDLNHAFAHPYAKVVWCSRGGYGLARIIDRLDVAALKQHPKWIVGFSDITVLHQALAAQGLPSLHAGMAKQLTLQASAQAVQQTLALLRGQAPTYSLPPHAFNRSGEAVGRIVGGNLSVLYGLRCTPYDPDYTHKILFLEDLCEPLYHIDRMVQNLRLGGVFEQIAGLVVGQFTDCNEDSSFPNGAYGILAEAVAGYRFPVCYQFPAGHVEDNRPWVQGAATCLQVGEGGGVLKQNLLC